MVGIASRDTPAPEPCSWDRIPWLHWALGLPRGERENKRSLRLLRFDTGSGAKKLVGGAPFVRCWTSDPSWSLRWLSGHCFAVQSFTLFFGWTRVILGHYHT